MRDENVSDFYKQIETTVKMQSFIGELNNRIRALEKQNQQLLDVISNFSIKLKDMPDIKFVTYEADNSRDEK